ncbi:hypothetical protein DUNSADRAFT_17934, partial [Dunaliella salina]
YPQSAPSREKGDTSGASAHPVVPAAPIPDLPHSASLGRTAVTGAGMPGGAPPVASPSSPGSPHHHHAVDPRLRANSQGFGGRGSHSHSHSRDSSSTALPAVGGAVQASAAHSPAPPASPSSAAPPGTLPATQPQRSSEFSRAAPLQPNALPFPTPPHHFNPSAPSPSHPTLTPSTSPPFTAGAPHSSSASAVLPPQGAASRAPSQVSHSTQQQAPHGSLQSAPGAVHACLHQPTPQVPRELHPVRPPPRMAFDANGSLSAGSEAGPLLTRNQQPSSELSPLLPHSPSAWAQRVVHPPRAISGPTDEGEPAAALAAAAAASMMRPVAPPPGGVRAVQSARPITRNGPAPDFSVWQGFIAQQLERPPSRQKPPPEALHLWSPEEPRSTLMGLPAGANTDLNSAYHTGPRLRARPHSAMVTLGGHGRSILSRAALRAQPASVPYGSMAGQHARPPTRDRPPTRQRPPPMALLLEQREEDAANASSQGDGLEEGVGGAARGRKGARGGQGQGPGTASIR